MSFFFSLVFLGGIEIIRKDDKIGVHFLTLLIASFHVYIRIKFYNQFKHLCFLCDPLFPLSFSYSLFLFISSKILHLPLSKIFSLSLFSLLLYSFLSFSFSIFFSFTVSIFLSFSFLCIFSLFF